MGGYRGETRKLVRLEFLSGNNGICITFKRMRAPAEGSTDAWRLFQNVVNQTLNNCCVFEWAARAALPFAAGVA